MPRVSTPICAAVSRNDKGQIRAPPANRLRSIAHTDKKLRHAMGLDGDPPKYMFFKKVLVEQAKEFFITEKGYDEQTEHSKELFNEEVKQRLPWIRRQYERSWPVVAYVTRYMTKRSAGLKWVQEKRAGRKSSPKARLAKAAARKRRVVSRSVSIVPETDDEAMAAEPPRRVQHGAAQRAPLPTPRPNEEHHRPNVARPLKTSPSSTTLKTQASSSSTLVHHPPMFSTFDTRTTIPPSACKLVHAFLHELRLNHCFHIFEAMGIATDDCFKELVLEWLPERQEEFIESWVRRGTMSYDKLRRGRLTSFEGYKIMKGIEDIDPLGMDLGSL